MVNDVCWCFCYAIPQPSSTCHYFAVVVEGSCGWFSSRLCLFKHKQQTMKDDILTPFFCVRQHIAGYPER